MHGLQQLPLSSPNEWVISTTACEPSPPFTLCIDHLDSLVDVYKAHYKCCGARFIWEGRLAQLQRTEEAQDNTTILIDSLIELADDIKGAHIGTKQEHAALVYPRDALRFVFPNQPPPVLRYDQVGECVYVLKGAFMLRANAPRPAIDTKAAIDAFPLFLAVKPSDDCADYLQCDPPHADSSLPPSPQLCLLQSIQRDANEKGGLTAVYSDFVWIVSPRGNSDTSLRVKALQNTAGGKTRAARQDLERGYAPSPSQLVTTASSSSAPICMQLDVYASSFADAQDEQAVAQQIRLMMSYEPFKTQLMRYGAGDAAARERRAEMQCRQTLLNRPAKLLRALDEGISSALRDKRPRSSGGDPQCSDPMAKLVAVGCVRSSKPLTREECVAPQSTVLGTIFPPTIAWPITFSVGNGDGDVEEVTSLSTFSDLSAVLKKIRNRID